MSVESKRTFFFLIEGKKVTELNLIAAGPTMEYYVGYKAFPVCFHMFIIMLMSYRGKSLSARHQAGIYLFLCLVFVFSLYHCILFDFV